MTTAVDAIYEDGVFKPERPVGLKEKTRVRLLIEDEAAVAMDDDPTGWKAVDELVGFIKDGPNEPVGRDHDKYLHDK